MILVHLHIRGTSWRQRLLALVPVLPLAVFLLRLLDLGEDLLLVGGLTVQVGECELLGIEFATLRDDELLFIVQGGSAGLDAPILHELLLLLSVI